MTGIELSKKFFFEAGLPLLKQWDTGLANRVAAGLVAGGFDSGCGSEIGGFDDEISRDHNWGPRFFLFMSERDKKEKGDELGQYLNAHLPAEFAGFVSTATTLPKNRVHIQTPRENLKAVLHLDVPPSSDVEWITIPEVWLFEYMIGPIFYEPAPLVAPLRNELAYYPDDVWFKRLSYAFFMLHLAGNVNRSVQRKDLVATQMYVNWLLQIAMRTCFLLRRRYAPYCKWLFKAFRQLPDLPDELPCLMETIAQHIDLQTVVSQLYRVTDIIGTMANDSRLIEPLPLRQKSPFVWTDFNCYGFMHAFHAKLKGSLRDTNPYENGPLDLQVIGGALNRETIRTAWETMKRG